MVNALVCRKCGNEISSQRLKLEFNGQCPWCLASFALGDPPPDVSALPSLVPGAGAFESLGKYVLTEQLGTGGMGEVWKALDTELNRWVALKFLKDQDPRELARFAREAHMAAKLSHPNIAAVHEIGKFGGRNYIAMQCIEGRTLETFPRNDRRLLVRLCLDAARALHHAHRHGVIHRDVKPGNLMVEESDEGMKAVVLDFGLARSIEGGEKLSMSGSVVGTPQYLSPEQARAEKLDERTDVYSLGATMYEIFTGKPLFEGENVYEILKKVENEAPIAPRKIKPQINQDLQTIILKCLEKNRERRYASAMELAHDLRRFLNHEAVLARPPSAIYRLRMKLSKRKSVVAAVAALLALVGSAAFVLPNMSAQSRARHRLAAYQRAYDEGRKAWDEVLQIVHQANLERTGNNARQARGHFEKAIGILEQADAQVMRGRCLQLEGKPKEAESAWERALVLDPGNQEACFHLAKMLLLDYLKARRLGVQVGPGSLKVASTRFEVGPESQGSSNLRRRVEQLLAAVGGGEKAVYLQGVREMCLRRHAKGAALLAQYNREGWDSASIALEGVACLYAEDLDGAIEASTRAIELDPKQLQAYIVRGIAKHAKGLLDEAIANFTKAIELNPKLAMAYDNRGIARQSKGLFDEAIADHTKAIELDPKSASSYSHRGKGKAGKGLFDEAIADYTKAIELDPTDEGAYINRGVVKVDKGLFDEAIADCTKAIELDPKSAVAYCNRGSAKQGKGLLDEAIADYTKAIELDPKYVYAFYNRGGAKRAKGLCDEAIADYTKAIELDPKFPMAFCNRGIAKSAQGLLDEAIADYTKAIELNPKHARAYNNRGNAKSAKGLHDEAIADLTKAIELDPTDAVTWNNRGTAKLNKGCHDEAIADYTKAIELDPKYAVAYRNRGVANLGKGFHDKAIGDFTKAIELDPKDAMSCCGRGAAKQAKGHHDDAIADYTKAVELEPRFAGAYLGRGNAKSAKGLQDQAIADFDEAVNRDPNYRDAYLNRGLAKNAKGLHDDAIADYTRAIELDPKFVHAFFNRGGAKQAKGHHDEAIADYTRAIELDPKLAMAYNNRGFSWSAKGLQDEAMADFEDAIKLNPEHWDAYLNRGIAKWTKGLLDEAMVDWEKALALAPPGYPHRTVIQELISTRGARLNVDEAHRLLGQKKLREAIGKYKAFLESHPKNTLANSCAYGIACGYALLGEKKNALDWLEKAAKMGWRDLEHLEKDADLDSLRNEDRYKKVIELLKK